MKRVLFAFWHGLGDNVLATPAIRAYKRGTGCFVGWAMLRRFRRAELFASNPFIDRLHWLSDAWNDFSSHDEGCRRVVEEARAIGRAYGYDRVCIVDHRSSMRHKILRTADEMDVDLAGDVRTEVYYNAEALRPLHDAIPLPSEYVFLHGQTGVPAKDLPVERAREWLSSQGIDLPIVSPHVTWDCRRTPIAFAMDVMSRARHIIVADSVMYHAAHAMGLKVDLAYFARGESVWRVVRPLHPCKEHVVYSL